MRRALVAQIVALQAADVFLTWWLLTSTGATFEGNPVVAGLLGRGFDKLVVAKVLGVAAIAWLSHDVMRERATDSVELKRRRFTAGMVGLWLAYSFALAVAVWDSIGVGLVWWYS